jgi:hypothetical protein
MRQLFVLFPVAVLTALFTHDRPRAAEPDQHTAAEHTFSYSGTKRLHVADGRRQQVRRGNREQTGGAYDR